MRLPASVEVYLAGTFTDSLSYFFELEYESSEIEGKEDGTFEEKSKFGLGKEFFLMLDLGRVVKGWSSPSVREGAGPEPAGKMRGRGIMGPMIMTGKIDPSTNFSYPTNRQFILNVPGKVDEASGMMERFSLTPYAFASKFYGVQTGSGESVEVTKEVLYNTTGDLGADIHLMMMPFMLQGGIMQGLRAGPSDVN